VKTGRIFQKQVYKTNPQYESLRFGFTNPDSRVRQPGFVNHDTKRIFLESGFVPTIRNESMDSRNESMFLRISYTIPASLGATQVGEFVIVFGIVFALSRMNTVVLTAFHHKKKIFKWNSNLYFLKKTKTFY
jgi:hypothetical protein